MYKELQINIGHFGTERVLQLMRERVFCPRMEKVIHHYIIKVYSSVKKDKGLLFTTSSIRHNYYITVPRDYWNRFPSF